MKKALFVLCLGLLTTSLYSCSLNLGGSSNNTSNSGSNSSSEVISNSSNSSEGGNQLTFSPIENPTLYTNKFDEEKIPNQWTEYGVGDPFVLRYNGKYYLYVSTKNFEIGVRGWVSEDLIHYEMLTGEGLETGYVSNDPCTLGAYAPEVIYKNGYFYMIQSQSGNGHYILRSEKPEGPFVKVKDNFGESIDGSFFVDDDESFYMLRASNTGIRIIQMNDDLTLGTSRTLDNTVLGGWTEGPYLLKRNGIYYLTYTGNHVVSEGYRIGYSYSQDKVFERDAFTEGGTIILNTDEEYKGLGHSSTVLGPDLDSYYIAYHNLNSSGGPNRSNNIARISFSGTEMIVEHPELEGNIIPNMPEFSSSDSSGFTLSNNKYLSSKETSDIYSAEYNFIGNDVSMICSYIDDSNYHYVNIKDDVLTFVEVNNGTENVLSTSEFVKDYDYTKLHTVRLQYKEGKVSIYFDNMNKINLEEHTLSKGKIGYVNGSDLTICHTSFSDVAHGSSDNKAIHQNKVLASSYYQSSFTGSELVENQMLEGEEDIYNSKIGSYDLLLKNKNDYASYRVYAEEDGLYALDMTLRKEYEGKNVIVKIDNETPIRMKIPSSNDVQASYYKATLGEVNMSQGSHYITIICEDEIRFSNFEYFLSSSIYPSFEHNLATYVDKGVIYVNSWKLKNDGHYALAGNRNLMYFGDKTLTDYTVEVDIELVGETQASSCGVILRADNPAFSGVDNVSSIQGYYVGFNNSKVFISKCNYNNSNMDVEADAYKSDSDKSYHLKMTAKGNKIELDFNNGAVVLSYVDPIGFTHGYVGFYTDGAAAIYRNLKISK